MLSARIETDSQQIATLWLDAPGKRVNTLSRQMWADLSEAIDKIERDKPAGLIITSAKNGTFVVGADLYEIRDMSDEEFDDYIQAGQDILRRIDHLLMPTVAAINGDCIGGGLELALACKLRVASSEGTVDVAKIGLPETRLGLIPGWGGTVRLLRLIGADAIRLILDGKLLSPADAQAAKIIQHVVAPKELITSSYRLLLGLIAHPLPDVSSDAILRSVCGSEVFSDVLGMYKRETLAPASKLAEVILEALNEGEGAWFNTERRAIVELRRTPEAQRLLGEFFKRQEHKKSDPPST